MEVEEERAPLQETVVRIAGWLRAHERTARAADWLLRRIALDPGMDSEADRGFASKPVADWTVMDDFRPFWRRLCAGWAACAAMPHAQFSVTAFHEALWVVLQAALRDMPRATEEEKRDIRDLVQRSHRRTLQAARASAAPRAPRKKHGHRAPVQ